MARLASVGEQIRVARQNTLAATQQKIAEAAKAAHREIMATDPRPTSFTRYVDGIQGAPEEDVKADGRIVYDYPRLPVVVMFALELLREFSPVATGAYRAAHTIFLDGAPVQDLSGWRSGLDVFIANPLPYARKIEIGSMTMRVPGTEQVYERAVSATNKRYGNLAKALFTYRGIVGAAGGRKSASQNRFPAIVFQER